MQKQYIKKFLRLADRSPYGVVVAVPMGDGKFQFGYSLCSPKDHFNKKLGTTIALRRAAESSERNEAGNLPTPLPDLIPRQKQVAKGYEDIEFKAERYFKS